MVNSDRRLAMTIRYKDLVRFRDYVAKTGGAASVDRLRVTDQELRAMEKEFQREFSCSIQSSAYGGGASASGENQSTAGYAF